MYAPARTVLGREIGRKWEGWWDGRSGRCACVAMYGMERFGMGWIGLECNGKGWAMIGWDGIADASATNEIHMSVSQSWLYSIDPDVCFSSSHMQKKKMER